MYIYSMETLVVYFNNVIDMYIYSEKKLLNYKRFRVSIVMIIRMLENAGKISYHYIVEFIIKLI